MLKTFLKSTLAISVIAVSTTAALAGGTATLSPVKKAIGQIEVVSQDGQTWSKVKNSVFTASLIITMKATGKDHVLGWELQQEGVVLTYSGDFGTKKDTNYSKVQSVIAHSKNIKLTRQAMINKCNAKLNVGNGIHQNHMVEGAANIALIAQFRHPAVLHKNRYTFEKKTIVAVPIDVKCVAVPKPQPKPSPVIGTLKVNPPQTHAKPGVRPKTVKRLTVLPKPKARPKTVKSLTVLPKPKAEPVAKVPARAAERHIGQTVTQTRRATR